MDNAFEVKDVIEAVMNDMGKDSLVGCVKMTGYWVITMKERKDSELLQETGLVINNEACNVFGVSRTLLTVSLFGIPAYIADSELTEKLNEYGCVIKGQWKHKTYPDFPNIENGTRFVRLELPPNVKSLPYAITIEGVHIRLKHNGQTKVCNLCLGEDHIMRSCPQYTCKECQLQGHTEAYCPKVKCFKCQDYGHKSFTCPTREQEEPMAVAETVADETSGNTTEIQISSASETKPISDKPKEDMPVTEKQTGKPACKQSEQITESNESRIPKPTSRNGNVASSITAKRLISSSDEEHGFIEIKSRKTGQYKPNLGSARNTTPVQKTQTK